MKKMMILLSLVLAPQAFAQSDFSFGQISLKGNGCPEGTFQVIPSPDQKTVSILFDKFAAEVPNYGQQVEMNNERIDQKICHIEIAANLPVGQRIDSFNTSIDFRGSANLEYGTDASFRSMLVQWRGLQRIDSTPKVIDVKSWIGGASEDWISSKTVSFPINSNCATTYDRQVNVTLRNLLTANIRSGISSATTSALVTVDSSDMKGSIKFSVNTSTCGYTPYPTPTPGPSACSGRIVTCRAPMVWSQTLCRCVRP